MTSTQTVRDVDIEKTWVLSSPLNFTRHFFKARFNQKFIPARHHQLISDFLNRILNGEIKKAMINLPPRYSKTELAVKHFIAMGLAANPSARFIHLSSSDELVLDNSSDIQDILRLPEYQRLFAARLANTNTKKWYTADKGGLYAVPSAGQVTGFGAGLVDMEEDETIDEFTEAMVNERFGGAIVVDDAIKPDDARSDTLRNKVNHKFDSTIRNRVNSRNTPILIIGHRLHVNDLFGYLLEKEPGQWDVLSIPVIYEGEALWPHKHTLEELHELRRIDPYVFATQYMQEPYPDGGGLVKKEWFVIIEENHVPQNVVWDLWIDGAYTENKANDPTGFMFVGFDPANNTLTVRFAESRWMTTPDVIAHVKDLMADFGNAASMIYIEPKASGYSFIQLLLQETLYNVTRITGRLVRDGKAARINYAAPKIQSSRVRLVRGNWNDEFITQHVAFPNYAHDEMTDLLGYAVKHYFG